MTIKENQATRGRFDLVLKFAFSHPKKAVFLAVVFGIGYLMHTEDKSLAELLLDGVIAVKTENTITAKEANRAAEAAGVAAGITRLNKINGYLVAMLTAAGEGGPPRAYMGRFHNGSGVNALFYSTHAEATSHFGIGKVGADTQNVPLSALGSSYLSRVFDRNTNGCGATLTEDLLMSAGDVGFGEILEYEGITAIVDCPVRDQNGVIVGVVGFDFIAPITRKAAEAFIPVIQSALCNIERAYTGARGCYDRPRPRDLPQ